MSAETEYFTPEELAKVLNLPRKTVVKWTQERRLPGMTRMGRLWRYRKSEVYKRLNQGDLLLPPRGK